MPEAHATLAPAAVAMLPRLLDLARHRGATVAEENGLTTITTAFSTIRLQDRDDGLHLEIRSGDAAALDGVIAVVEQFVAGAAHMSGPIPWRRSGGSPRLSMAEVAGVTRLSPGFSRLRLTGDFTRFLAGGLHFRLLLGPDGVAPPTADARGEPVWPGGIDCWHRPPYTVRHIDENGRWIDVDIFLHDGGRVTEWLEDVRPGDTVALTGPGGRGVRQAGWLGLVGDETALPVILRTLAAAGPDTRGQAVIVVGDAADAQPVDLPPGLHLHWAVRDGIMTPLDHFRALAPPASDRFLFFAGERQEAALAREHAMSSGLAAAEVHAAYWTAGWVPPAGQRQARAR